MRERTIRYFAYLAADADKAAALCWLRGGSGGVAGEGGGRIAIGDRTPQRTLRLQQSIHQERKEEKYMLHEEGVGAVGPVEQVQPLNEQVQPLEGLCVCL